ncbi:hypothetical protein [Flavobacterium pallidum]|uniref:Aromatic ring-opening dioxygenase LigA n=1 Tax=Flavobacterium pallidum TaxID=2172098 RepID=A0A2S1SIZ6_9FLAO|nr:hypothetical protein [Flavobacterium pallidum]AWI26312.1 hypothetical protein HYN49_10600 [Flavobacterium pallidum]
MVELNFINYSNDTNNSSIVFFQQNELANPGESPIAWKVIQNSMRGDNHPFSFTMHLFVDAADSSGNRTQQQPAYYGQELKASIGTSGYQIVAVGSQFLVYTDDPIPIPAIGVNNASENGNIAVNVYRDGNLLATATGVAPVKYATFKFSPSIWIGVTNYMTEGDVLNSSVMAGVSTKLSLLGIAKANIIMTGGGPGTDSPFKFTLEPLG